MILTFSFIARNKDKIFHYSRILSEEKYSQIEDWEIWKQRAKFGLKLQIPEIKENDILVIVWEKQRIMLFEKATQKWLEELIKT